MNYYGYRYEKDGRYHSGDLLKGAEEVYNYLKSYKCNYPNIKIVDKDDLIIAETLKGHIIFPPQLAIINISESYFQNEERFEIESFITSMEGSGFVLGERTPQNREEAELVLNELYNDFNKV